ncbi:enoyl-CoA hydratase/isomerase family protein [Pigmentiphaga soli]|uniref:Enoyl-CoA hydratase/isomerase family protein n=1 Tax=Pigmentiphaga soli TaxID=1007095 RepID=A0ABP8GPB2_9BURK
MTTSPYSHLTLDRADGVAILTLNRPQVRNAIDDAMREELLQALHAVGRDDQARALVLTGAGPAFCAGGDISAMRQRLALPPGRQAFSTWQRQTRTMESIRALMDLGKPTVAALNGVAAGVGCDMALACDLVVAADSAAMIFSYVARGLVPDGALYLLPRRVGLSRAKELIYSGRRVDAAESLSIGLVDKLETAETLLPAAISWAASLCKGSPTALALSKSILNQSLDASATHIFDLARHAQALCATSAEHADAVGAFLRKP